VRSAIIVVSHPGDEISLRLLDRLIDLLAERDPVELGQDCRVAVSADLAPARYRARFEGAVRGSSRAGEARARPGSQRDPCPDGIVARRGEYRQDPSCLRYTRHPRWIAVDCIGLRRGLDVFHHLRKRSVSDP